MTQPYGWNVDPYGLHEHRYFSGGLPTKLVRDGGRESYEEPPNYPPPAVHPGTPIGAQPSQVAVSTRSTRVEIGPVEIGEQTRVNQQGSSPSWLRRLKVPLLGCLIALVIALTIVTVVLAGGGRQQKSACSLLTNAQASALLGFTDINRTTLYLEKPAADVSSCSFGPSAREVTEMEHNPQTFSESFRTLQLTIETAPKKFPLVGGRKFGTPMSVDGHAALWFSILPEGPNPASASAHILAAVKDGYEVAVQTSAWTGAERYDKEALSEVLGKI